jgi:hypothetical protein
MCDETVEASCRRRLSRVTNVRKGVATLNATESRRWAQGLCSLSWQAAETLQACNNGKGNRVTVARETIDDCQGVLGCLQVSAVVLENAGQLAVCFDKTVSRLIGWGRRMLFGWGGSKV